MIDTKRNVTRQPTQDEKEAMQRVYNKINEAELQFDIEACVQLAKVLTHYDVQINN